MAQLIAMDSPGPSRRKLPAWLPQVLGYGVSAACLIWVLRGYRFSDLMEADLEWKWIGVAATSDMFVYVVHAWRWNTLMAPVARLGLWRTLQAIYIGLFANELLPLRVGELIRVYLLTHWNDLRLSLGFASAAVERVIDGCWLLTAFLITAALVRIPESVMVGVRIFAGLLAVGAVALVWIARQREPRAVIYEGRWSAVYGHIVEGLHLMGNRRTLVLTALISALYLAVQMFSCYALMKAYKLDFSFWVAGGVVTIIRLATVVPNAPGNLGLMNWATVMALGLFDLKPTDAKTFSIILFATWTLPLLIGGAIATALTGVNIGEIHARARRSVDAAP